MTTKHKQGGTKGGNQYGSYQVRYASQKQQDFIKKLLERKQNNLVVDLSTLNVQGAKELITNLLSLPDKTTFFDYATEKQISFAMSLVNAKEGGLDLLNTRLQDFNALTIEKLSKAQVSLLISELRLKEDTKPTVTEVGAYLYEGVVYSIRNNQNKKLIIWTYNAEQKKYERNYSATKKLLSQIKPEHRLTLEQAVKYSAHTGLCVHCGRSLTLLKSVASGMGAWCAKKYH